MQLIIGPVLKVLACLNASVHEGATQSMSSPFQEDASNECLSEVLETQWEKDEGLNHNGRMWVQECVRECEGGVKWTYIQ